MLSFAERAALCTNPTAKKLLTLMEEKRSNLAVSVDVVRQEELLKLADLLGPEICILKTHIDILEDFTPETTERLTELAHKHSFLLFEDRKFADIGNTVKLQYGAGLYKIADWADITNAHPIPGPGIIEGLKEVGLPKGRGLLLLAQMSSRDNLVESYLDATLRMSKDHTDFVIGFIAQKKLIEDPRFIYLTPGVQLAATGDSLGQQYITPWQAIYENKTDIIIVGRGIYQNNSILESAQHYRKMAWDIYQSLNNKKENGEKNARNDRNR